MTRLTQRRNNQVRVLRVGLLFLCVLLCQIQVVQRAQESDSAIRAKQKATTANDNSHTLEDRRTALATLEEATTLFLSSGETVEAARALNRVGRLQLVLNDPKTAIESHTKALDLLKQMPSREAEVDNLNGFAAAQMVLYEPKLAGEALRRAINLSKQSGYSTGNAEALLILSDLENYTEHDRALTTARKSLALSQSNDNKDGIASAYFQMGQYYMALQRLADSKQSNEKALALWLELRNPERQADALIALGQIEYRKGAWEDAMSIFSRAENLLDSRAEPMRMGQISIGYGESLNSSGMPESALINMQRGLAYYQQTQKPDYIAYAVRVIGQTHFLLGNYSEAITQLQKSFEGVREGDSQSGEPHEWLARVYIAMGNYDVALEHLETALPIFVKAPNPLEAARIRGSMGRVFQLQGDTVRARQLYQQALDDFTRMEDRVNLSAINFALGSLELEQENLNAAESYLRKSIEGTEDMRRVSASSDLTAAFSATVHERYEAYIECLMRKNKSQPDRNLNVRAFEISEQSRGRSLVELLQATQTGVAPGLEPQLAEQEKSLRQSLRVKEDDRLRLLATAYKIEELTAIDKEITEMKAQYTELFKTISARFPSFEQINRPITWDVRKIQERVVADDETLLLEYTLGADRSYAWAITRDRITSYELPSEFQINDAAQKVYRLIATRPVSQATNELDQATQELSKMILSPVAAELGKRRIIIVADGALNYIPFQLLSATSSDRQQLIATHEIINGPSASILGQLRQETTRRQPAPNALAAFGDPVFATSYAKKKDTGDGEQIAYAQSLNDDQMRTALRDVEVNGDSFDPTDVRSLFYAKQELANLREVAGDETLLATGFDATLEKLEKTDLTKYSALHFATHGVLDPKRPERSGLILSTVDRDGNSKNGFVGLSKIYNLHAPVDLVVLSACRTGLGKDIRGEGLIGITRGFMYAGASSVVASLWKVDDEATAELMKIFYTNLLRNGMTPAAALSAAQNSIRRQERWRSPYYWAAFTIQGDSRSVIKAKRTTTPKSYESFIALFAFTVLLAIVSWSYRRHLQGMTK